MTDLAAQLFSPSALAVNRLRLAKLPRPQPRAPRTVMDVSEFFGETSGGVRTYLTEKAKYVERSSQIRQSIIVPGPWDIVTQSERVRCYRLSSMRVPGQPPYRFLLDVRASRRILANEHPDVIEIGSPGFAPWHVLALARRLGIPAVFFYHSHVPRLLEGTRGRPGLVRRSASALAWRYLRMLQTHVETTIVSSRFAADELGRGGIERTSLIPLGVDLEQFHPSRRKGALYLRTRLGVGDRPLILYAGRIAAEKRLDIVLRAWPRISARTGAVLAIAGDGPLRRSLASQFPHRDVRWLGFMSGRAELASLFATADAVVTPGGTETFGLAAVEALASGTPVIAANAGATAELAANSGAGFLYELRSVDGLANAVDTLLQTDSHVLALRARAYAEERHGWDGVFRSVFDLYDLVVGGRA